MPAPWMAPEARDTPQSPARRRTPGPFMSGAPRMASSISLRGVAPLAGCIPDFWRASFWFSASSISLMDSSLVPHGAQLLYALLTAQAVVVDDGHCLGVLSQRRELAAILARIYKLPGLVVDHAGW